MKLSCPFCSFLLCLLASARAFTNAGRSTRPALISTSTSTSAALPVTVSSRPSSSSTRLYSTTTTEELIQTEIDTHNVVVFSKSYCPFCLATKMLFTNLGVDFHVIELDQRPDGYDIQKSLAQTTGQRTVPNVFVKGQQLGGNDKVQALARSGELQKLLGIKK